MIKQLHKLLLLAAAFLFVANSYGEKVVIDGIYYNLNQNNKTASVTSGWRGTGHVTIPASITYYNKEYSVTSIGNSAFFYCSGLTSITLPSSVTSIGVSAFRDCSGLTSITLPSSLTSIGNYAFRGCRGLTSITLPSSLTSIGSSAFSDCSGLTSITLPSSLTSIGSSAFSYCSGLTSITLPSSLTSIGSSAFSDCSGLTSITLPSSLTSIGDLAFRNCSGLTSITLPPSVTSIGGSAFYGCSGLTSITLPPSVTSIGGTAFYDCRGLTSILVSDSNPEYSSVDGMLCNKGQTVLIAVPNGKTGSITLPSSLTSIGDLAFRNCSGLTSITLPPSVTSIGGSAFYGCSGLTSITLPPSVTNIGNSAFYGCTLNPLYILGKQLNLDICAFSELAPSSIIFAYNTEFEAIHGSWNGKLMDIEDPYYISIFINKINMCSMSFRIALNDYADIMVAIRSVKFGDTEITPDENGLYTVTGLEPGTSYEIVVTYETAEGEERSQTETVRTKELVIDASNSATQTTATLRITASEDESCSLTKKGIIFDGKTYECKDDKVVLTDLVPGRKYYATLFADYGSKRVMEDGFSFTTKSLQPAIVQQDLGPTSVTLRGSHTAGDAHVSETGFIGHDGGNALILTGLKPETEYTVTYYVRTKEGSNESASRTFTTPALELTTLQPRSVSNSCAIVAATTNISEDETSVGFQWKKYDAPASLAPSEGYAAIYGGQLEGYIRNLQSTSYYNVRAFYKSAEGDYYYGGWVTFDPSDFSYFEPTVHTYAAAEVTHSSAWMKGYILAGTDAIEKQGFEYWPLNSGAAKAMGVNGAAVAGNVQTVLATGQVMRAELRDLLPATTYCCRAFVKTATGTTYGEELTFTTLDVPTGVGAVEAATPDAPTVIGYYDLSGRKSATPHRGVNIVRYSDGTARKMIVK